MGIVNGMPCAIMALSGAAVERTGQKLAFTASWWMTSPRCPFF